MTIAQTPFVRESGQGTPTLCLHANASSSSQWRGLMDQMAPQFRMLAPDLLGVGRSGPWPVLAGARMQHELDALAPPVAADRGRSRQIGFVRPNA